MPATLMSDIVITLALGLAVVFLCQRLKIPTIVGFLLTGVLAGPHGLGLIAHSHEVEVLAEIGVVLLLFTIGLEFSFGELVRLRRPMLLGGSLQVGLTVLLVTVLAMAMGRLWGTSVFAGCVLALSSTAIVLKLLQERTAVDSPQGRASLAILLYQDVIVVVMLLVTPLLAAGGGESDGQGWLVLAKGAAAVLVLVAAAKWAAPWLLHQMAATRNRELFMVTIVVMCLAVAWLTAWAGLSLALGAFLAGLIISESPYSHQAVGNILPLRDLFTSLFFISIGMLLDLGFLAQHPLAVGATLLAVLALKTVVAALAALALRLPLRVALPVGLVLCQVGEFSFILARAGIPHGLLDPWTYQLILVVSVLTMALTPPLMALGFALAGRPWPRILAGRNPVPAASAAPAHAEALSGHVIVVGFGLGGRKVARAACLAGIPYLVLEMNPFTVRTEQAKGEPIVFGDAVNPSVLEHVGVARARALVITIPDPVAARHLVASAKHLNPSLHIIARVRYLTELDALKRLGAEDVVSEEYESAVEIFARLLKRLLVPQSEIERLVGELKAGNYERLRPPAPDDTARPAAICDLRDMLPEVEIATLAVEDGAPAVGRSLAGLELRKRHGLTVLAVRRAGGMRANPRPDEPIAAGDWLVVMARPQRLAEAGQLFRAPEPAKGVAGPA
ncbi:MAG: cation:proton antiporter [Thermodesulfobacteriota bacterium]